LLKCFTSDEVRKSVYLRMTRFPGTDEIVIYVPFLFY
jgi:hypothetical protein